MNIIIIDYNIIRQRCNVVKIINNRFKTKFMHTCNPTNFISVESLLSLKYQNLDLDLKLLFIHQNCHLLKEVTQLLVRDHQLLSLPFDKSLIFDEGFFAYTSVVGGEHKFCIGTNTSRWFGAKAQLVCLIINRWCCTKPLFGIRKSS